MLLKSLNKTGFNYTLCRYSTKSLSKNSCPLAFSNPHSTVCTDLAPEIFCTLHADFTPSYTRTRSIMHPHTPTLMHTHPHTCTHTHAHSLTHTHLLTHIPNPTSCSSSSETQKLSLATSFAFHLKRMFSEKLGECGRE